MVGLHAAAYKNSGAREALPVTNTVFVNEKVIHVTAACPVADILVIKFLDFVFVGLHVGSESTAPL
jgi:hypothetical protein